MTNWAILPVKSLQETKSRLAEVLSRKERAALSMRLLIHTLEQLNCSRYLERTLVVSKDSEVLSISKKLGATTLMEHGDSNLNLALERATAVVRGYGASGALILPADLPHVAAEDIDAILAYASNPPVVVIAPDRGREGTNAILSAPPGLIEYQFGPGSFKHHLKSARSAGVRAEVLDLPSFAFDLDWPEDLALLQAEDTSTG